MFCVSSSRCVQIVHYNWPTRNIITRATFQSAKRRREKRLVSVHMSIKVSMLWGWMKAACRSLTASENRQFRKGAIKVNAAFAPILKITWLWHLHYVWTYNSLQRYSHRNDLPEDSTGFNESVGWMRRDKYSFQLAMTEQIMRVERNRWRGWV